MAFGFSYMVENSETSDFNDAMVDPQARVLS